MIDEVIYAVRKHVICEFDEIPDRLALTCPNGHEHNYPLPSNIEIYDAINANNDFVYKCRTCPEKLVVSSKTLELRAKG